MNLGRRITVAISLAAVISVSLAGAGEAAKKKKKPPPFDPDGIYVTKTLNNGVNFMVDHPSVTDLNTQVIPNCPSGTEFEGRPVEVTSAIPLTRVVKKKKAKKGKKGKKVVTYTAAYSGPATSNPDFIGPPDSHVALSMRITRQGNPPGTATGTMTVTPKDPFNPTADCAPITFQFNSFKRPPRTGGRG